MEVTVVACKGLVASEESGSREAMVSCIVGQSKQATERMPNSLNPVFNKPMIFKVRCFPVWFVTDITEFRAIHDTLDLT